MTKEEIIERARKYLKGAEKRPLYNGDAEVISSLLEIVEQPKWWPISKAPKDEEVFCYDENWSESGVALAEDFGGYWQISDRDDATTGFQPTHWKPVPGRPLSTKQEGGE